MKAAEIPQNYPGIVPDQPYSMPLGDGTLWIRAGFAIAPHHRAAGQDPTAPPQGQDSIYGMPEKGAFVVCDGASGETDGGMDPARSGRLAARFLVEQFSGIPHGMSDNEMQVWADEQMNSASMLIDYYGGGRATALAVGPTLDERGNPTILLAARGDSRAASSHPDVLPNRSLDYWQRYASFPNWAHNYEQRKADGFNGYEVTVDKGFQTWVGTPSKRNKQETQTVKLSLKPGERERMIMVTDGISGSENQQSTGSFLPRSVVEKAIRNGTPQQSISYLLRNSTKRDDKAGYTIDFGYQSR